MPDFMISLFAQSGWLAWLVFVLACSGAAFWCVQIGIVTGRVTDRVLARSPSEGDDPPEYEPDEEPPGEWIGWDEPGDDWSPSLAWGPSPFAQPMAGLAEVLARAHALGLLTEDEAREHLSGERCTDRDCDLYGEPHPPPCVLMPTMPAACWPDGPPKWTDPDKPAGPPLPWSGLHASLETLARSEDVPPALHPKVAAELGHDTTEGAVDSIYTGVMANEVKRMLEAGK